MLANIAKQGPISEIGEWLWRTICEELPKSAQPHVRPETLASGNLEPLSDPGTSLDQNTFLRYRSITDDQQKYNGTALENWGINQAKIPSLKREAWMRQGTMVAPPPRPHSFINFCSSSRVLGPSDSRASFCWSLRAPSRGIGLEGTRLFQTLGLVRGALGKEDRDAGSTWEQRLDPWIGSFPPRD